MTETLEPGAGIDWRSWEPALPISEEERDSWARRIANGETTGIASGDTIMWSEPDDDMLEITDCRVRRTARVPALAALSNPVSSRDAEGESPSPEQQIRDLKENAKSVARAHAERVEALTKDRDYFKSSYARKLEDEKRALETAAAAQDELRVAWSDCHDGSCRACAKCHDAAEARAEALRAALEKANSGKQHATSCRTFHVRTKVHREADPAARPQTWEEIIPWEEKDCNCWKAEATALLAADAALESPRPTAPLPPGSRGFAQAIDQLSEKGKEVVPSAPTDIGHALRSDLSTGPTATPGVVGEVAPAAPAASIAGAAPSDEVYVTEQRERLRRGEHVTLCSRMSGPPWECHVCIQVAAQFNLTMRAAPAQLPEAPRPPPSRKAAEEWVQAGGAVSGVLAWTPEAGGEAEKAKAIGPLGPTGDAGEKEASDPETVRRRITEYLSLGGLFNPEMMDHQKVSRLVQDARDAIERLLSERKGLRAEAFEEAAHAVTDDYTLELRSRVAAAATIRDYARVRALAARPRPKITPR